MTSWRERLCGSVALNNQREESTASLQQFLTPNETVSCGGGFFPTTKNMANMQTFRAGVVLPTDQYSVLMFRQDGTAVIYSDTDQAAPAEEYEVEEESSPPKL